MDSNNTTKVIHKRKEYVGIVSSDKMQKTRVVEVVRLTQDKLYKKTIRRKIKFKAHDEKNESAKGDKVRIVETKPFSKDKRWRMAEIITRAKVLGEVA